MKTKKLIVIFFVCMFGLNLFGDSPKVEVYEKKVDNGIIWTKCLVDSMGNPTTPISLMVLYNDSRKELNIEIPHPIWEKTKIKACIHFQTPPKGIELIRFKVMSNQEAIHKLHLLGCDFLFAISRQEKKLIICSAFNDKDILKTQKSTSSIAILGLTRKSHWDGTNYELTAFIY